MSNPFDVSEETLRSASDMKCSKCEGILFDQAVIIRRVSPLMSKSGKAEIYPVGLYVCRNCSYPLELE